MGRNLVSTEDGVATAPTLDDLSTGCHLCSPCTFAWNSLISLRERQI
jgi:hypothetical protein